jgi:hypothetical protein
LGTRSATPCQGVVLIGLNAYPKKLICLPSVFWVFLQKNPKNPKKV